MLSAQLGAQGPGSRGQRGGRKYTVDLSAIPAPEEAAVHGEMHGLLPSQAFPGDHFFLLSFIPFRIMFR